MTVEVPRDLEATAHRDLGIFSPRSDWQVGEDVYPAGSLVVGGRGRGGDASRTRPSASRLWSG